MRVRAIAIVLGTGMVAVTSSPQAMGTGQFEVPQVGHITANLPPILFSEENSLDCLIRIEQPTSPSLDSTVACYSAEIGDPLPPPPFQPHEPWVLSAAFDDVTGVVTLPVLPCSDIGGFGLDITATIQLQKPGTTTLAGNITVKEDFTQPFDCADAIQTVGALTLTVLPQSHDEDSDGCADWEELGAAQNTGGLRDPFNFWDLYDVPTGVWPNLTRNKAVTASDSNAVFARFGSTGNPNVDPLSAPPAPPAYHPAYDRGASLGPESWNRDKANGSITSVDVNAAIAQFGHSCFAPP